MATLTINGKKHTIEADSSMPLLWAIRDIVGLTGTKFGCGKGLCGACSVLLDGVSVRSCLTPVSAAEGKIIVTIEGVENENKVLQEVWDELNVAQCGYCQSGQIISATALLASNANPSSEDIDTAMSGNICRCGTYPRIKSAILKTAELNQNSK
ncbi:(2Fe-2S)-binding protein [Flavobacteriaceae bacterium F08102]|nr:(2Fe-2S)-binding protein [Flavobacteriaceae bacterium F08102]